MTTNGHTPDFREYDDFFNLRTVEHEASHVIPYIKSNSRIIDVGCGIGAITFDLARRAPEGYVLGVDYSADSIRIAKERTRALGLTNIEFVQGDATNLSESIPSDSFDISHSHQVLIHLQGDGPIQALKSIRRVVKPGGIITTRDNHSRFIYPSTPALDRNFNVFKELAEERGAYPDAGHINHVWMHEAGFAWDSIQFGDVCKSINSKEEKESYARSFTGSFLKTFGKEAETDEEKNWLGEYQKDLTAWGKKPEARFAWYDGWVIARK